MNCCPFQISLCLDGRSGLLAKTLTRFLGERLKTRLALSITCFLSSTINGGSVELDKRRWI